MTSPVAVALEVADDPDAWAAAGFAVDDEGVSTIGGVRVHLVGPDAGKGVVGWSLAGLPEGAAATLDGFPTRPGEDEPEPSSMPHPNGITGVDHIVLLTDDLSRTVTAAAEVGLTPRHWRDHALPDQTPVRQTFFVLGTLVLELVSPLDAPSSPRPGVRSFGLALVAEDIDATAAWLGDRLGPVRPAVQPGRRIATLRGREVGLRTPVAVMTPR